MQDNGITTAPAGRRRRIRSGVFLLAAGAASTVLFLTAGNRASAEPLDRSDLGTPSSLRPARPGANDGVTRPMAAHVTASADVEPSVGSSVKLVRAGDAAPLGLLARRAPSGPTPPPVTVPTALPGLLQQRPVAVAPTPPQPSAPAGPAALFRSGVATPHWTVVRSATWIAARATRRGLHAAGVPQWAPRVGANAHAGVLARLRARRGAVRSTAFRLQARQPDRPVPERSPAPPGPPLPASFAAPLPTAPAGPPDQGPATLPPAVRVGAGGSAHRATTDGTATDGRQAGAANGCRAPPPQEVH